MYAGSAIETLRQLVHWAETLGVLYVLLPLAVCLLIILLRKPAPRKVKPRGQAGSPPQPETSPYAPLVGKLGLTASMLDPIGTIRIQDLAVEGWSATGERLEENVPIWVVKAEGKLVVVRVVDDGGRPRLSREAVTEKLNETISRLSEVLVPWGFCLEFSEVAAGHGGAYGEGRFSRGCTRIEFAYYASDGFCGPHYTQEIVAEVGYLREIDKWIISHQKYMGQLGHGEDSYARLACLQGGDRVEATVRDLREYAAPTLERECPEFLEIMQTGHVVHRYIQYRD